MTTPSATPLIACALVWTLALAILLTQRAGITLGPIRRGLPYGWWRSGDLWATLACLPTLILFAIVFAALAR